jgi:hypothetical protein
VASKGLFFPTEAILHLHNRTPAPSPLLFAAFVFGFGPRILFGYLSLLRVSFFISFDVEEWASSGY